MKAKYLLYVFIFVVVNGFNVEAWAMPQHVIMWFLKEPKAGALIQWLNLQFAFTVRKGPLTAASDEEKCIPMDGGCFHPQYGLIEGTSKKNEKPPELEGPPMPGVPSLDEVAEEE
ncbi:MAG: hypothetical protein AABY86_04790, partial [Bdellovibrionota bacterium]